MYPGSKKAEVFCLDYAMVNIEPGKLEQTADFLKRFHNPGFQGRHVCLDNGFKIYGVSLQVGRNTRFKDHAPLYLAATNGEEQSTNCPTVSAYQTPMRK